VFVGIIRIAGRKKIEYHRMEPKLKYGPGSAAVINHTVSHCFDL